MDGRVTWDMIVGGLRFSPESGITASTTQTQGQRPLTQIANLVETVANADDVVTLPEASPGLPCLIRNVGANDLQIFPANGDAIDGAAANASITLAPDTAIMLIAMDSTNWHTFGSA